MASLYSNENFPLPAVEKLRALGHDVLTLNRLHFVRLHRQQPGHAGIIVCRFDPDFEAQAGRIHKAIAGQTTLAGQLLRVNRG